MMKNYIISLTLCSIIGAFIYAAAPNKVRKYVSILTSVMLIALIISPINNSVDWNFKMEDKDTEENNAEYDTNKLAAESLAISLSKTLEKDYKIKAISIIVDVSETSSFDVNMVSISIGETTCDNSKIEKRLSDLYNCKITITE